MISSEAKPRLVVDLSGRDLFNGYNIMKCKRIKTDFIKDVLVAIKCFDAKLQNWRNITVDRKLRGIKFHVQAAMSMIS